MEWTDRLGQKGQHSYGPGDRLDQSVFRKAPVPPQSVGDEESRVTFTYNTTTHLLSSVFDSCSCTYTFQYGTSTDCLMEEHGPIGVVTSDEDDLGRRSGLSFQHGDAFSYTPQSPISYGYNATHDLVSITQVQEGQTRQFSFEYDPLVA